MDNADKRPTEAMVTAAVHKMVMDLAEARLRSRDGQHAAPRQPVQAAPKAKPQPRARARAPAPAAAQQGQAGCLIPIISTLPMFEK